jgi:hypothetical protein
MRILQRGEVCRDDVYRDHLQAAEIRRQQLIQRQALERLDPIYATIYRARLRRIYGATGALGALLIAAIWAIQPLHYVGLVLGFPKIGYDYEYTFVPVWFFSGWLFGALGGLVAHLAAPALFARAFRRRAALGGELFRDLDALERKNANTLGREVVEQHARLSFGLPLAALILLTPLSVHGVVAIALGVSPIGFATYMAVTTFTVGHAYIVLIFMAFRHVKLCQREQSCPPAEGPPKHRGWSALGAAVAASCVPGILVFGIPPLVVALTGALFVPWIFDWVAYRSCLEQLP